MEKVNICLGNKKLLALSLLLIKAWYFFWILFATISVVVFFILPTNSLSLGRFVFVSSILVFKSWFYLKIVINTDFLLRNGARGASARLSQLSFSFFSLFLLDFVGLVSGGARNISGMAAKRFFDVLPSGGWIHEAYSKIYLYLPAVLDFLSPKVEGIALLVISIIFANGYRNECRASAGIE